MIILSSDHAGFSKKEILKKYLIKENIEYYDCGTFSDETTDYPIFAHKMVEKMSEDSENLGFAFCGSGNGINMTLNKYSFIRAALCWNKDLVILSRLHNNANILSFPSKFIENEDVIFFFNLFITTKFDGGRHERRIKMMNK